MEALVNPEVNYKSGRLGDRLAAAVGCPVALLLLAFYAGCALVVIAAIVLAWHYLFG